MQNSMRWSCLAAAFAVLLLVPGCLIVSGDEPDDGECWQECDTYPHCYTYCDSNSCWEECEHRESCETVCRSDAHFPDDSEFFDEPAECYSDRDCADGRICIGNDCRSMGTDERGSAGLCQSCESRQDCVEEDALCLGFVTDGGDGEIAETVCGRSCTGDSDCPTGFECVDVDDPQEGMMVSQCVPEREGDETRTCRAGGELECVTASDCDVGERCADNRCEPPEDAQCTDDGHCETGEVCEVFECVDEDDSRECITTDDCSGNDICINGECVAEAESCVFNLDCAEDEACVDGQCTLTCEDDSDCGGSERCRTTDDGDGICEFIECYGVSDCSPGETCVDASCERLCSTDSDCYGGYRCSSNDFCEPDPQYECRYSAECADDEGCSDDFECEPLCVCNDDCSGDQICGADTNLCVDPGSGEDGLAC